MIYHTLFHSTMSYGILFWGNSSQNSVIFKLQKRAIRTMIGSGHRETYRNLFVELKIMPLALQYIHSLLLFVVNNKSYFILNSAYHDSNTRHKNNFQLPQATLAMYQKGVYYSGVKVFNSLPRTLKDISSKLRKFKIALKHFSPT